MCDVRYAQAIVQWHHLRLTISEDGILGTTPLRSPTTSSVDFVRQSRYDGTSSRPVAVVLFVGMNDAVNEKRFLRPDETASAVVQILQLIAAAHAEAFIVTVHYPDEARLMQRHPSGSFDGQTAARRIDATNQAFRDAATQGGVSIIDFNAALSKAGGASARLSTDGVHLPRAGYELLALTVVEALPKKGTHGMLLCLGDRLTYGTGVRVANSPDEGSDSYPQQLKHRLNGNL